MHPRDFSLGEVPQPYAAALRALVRPPARHRPSHASLSINLSVTIDPVPLTYLPYDFVKQLHFMQKFGRRRRLAPSPIFTSLSATAYSLNTSARTLVHVSGTVFVVSRSVEKRPDEGDGVPVQGVIGGVRFRRRTFAPLPRSPVPRVKLRLGVALELGW